MKQSQQYNTNYDSSLEYGITMYDNLPYQRNADKCNENHVTLISGQVIKYYMCTPVKTCYTINNHDTEIEQILREARIREKERLKIQETEQIVEPETDDDERIEDPIQSLVQDPSEEADDTDPASLYEAQ